MFEGPLTEKGVHLCVDMQRIFQDGLWRTPWMTRVLPVVTEIAGRFPNRTMFTRFINAAPSGGDAGPLAAVLHALEGRDA